MARCSQAFSYDHGYHSEFEFEPDDYLAADQDIALLETYTGENGGAKLDHGSAALLAVRAA